MCRLSGDQSQHNTLAWWPFKMRRTFKLLIVIGSRRSATLDTEKFKLLLSLKLLNALQAVYIKLILYR